MKILIRLNAQRNPFFISVANKFYESGHDVTIVHLLPSGLNSLRSSGLLKKGVELLDLPILDDKVPDEEVLIEKLLEYEKKYNFTSSFILAQDRGLGRGYLFNIDRYPNRVDGWYSYETKLRKLLKKFMVIESLIEKIQPEMILTIYTESIVTAVAKHNEINTVQVNFSRASVKCMFYDDSMRRNFELEKRLEYYINNIETLSDYTTEKLVRDPKATITHSKYKVSYIKAINQIIKYTISQLRRSIYHIRINHKNTGYTTLAWGPSIIRQVRNYKYICKNSIRINDIKKYYKTVFFPLHLEPELALMGISPEFSNSLEAISWISKSLPANYLLIVKEHPLSYGVRSKTYYDFLRQIPNVMLSHPKIDSWDWIKKSSFVATITGTAGFEGVYLNKPILSFGMHQVINKLPTVHYASDYKTTKMAVKKILKLPPNSPELLFSSKALSKAMDEISFNLPGFAQSNNKSELMSESAEIFYNKIIERYKK
jgi:hypothetical protein